MQTGIYRLWAWRAALIATALLALARSDRSGAAEVSELASLVPADVGMCVELTDMAEHGGPFLAGRFYERVQSFPPYAKWAGASTKPVTAVLERLAKHLGVTREELLVALFGRRVVFGAWPGADGELASGPGLLLADASDPALLRSIVDTLCSGMSGNAEDRGIRTVEHAGASYRVRTMATGATQQSVCLAVRGSIGILTNSESVMRGVLELAAEDSIADRTGLTSLEAYQDALTHVHADAPVVVFLNPRRWDNFFADVVEPELRGPVDVIGDAARVFWRASQYWVSSVEIGDGLQLNSFLHVDGEQLPPPMRGVLDGLRGDAGFLDRIPDDCIMAMAGSVDFRQLVDSFLSGGEVGRFGDLDAVRDMTRAMFLGLDLFDDVIPGLGPGVTVALVPHAADDSEDASSWMIGVETQPRDDDDRRPSVAAALHNGLKTAMYLAAGFLNDDDDDTPARVEAQTIDGVEITSLEGIRLLPKHIVATVARIEDTILAGTSSDVIERVIHLEPSQSLGQSARFVELLEQGLPNPSQVIYVDCARMQRALGEQDHEMLALVRQARQLDRATAEAGLAQLQSVLALSDTLLLAAKVEDDGLAFSLIFAMDESRSGSDAQAAVSHD